MRYIMLFCLIYASSKTHAALTVSISDYGINEIVISYTADTNYLQSPFNIWNSQVITIRYPKALGDIVIDSISNLESFEFIIDDEVFQDSTHYYQKLTAAEPNVVQNFIKDASVDVLIIHIDPAVACIAAFELLSENEIIEKNYGVVATNSAFNNDFDKFSPSIVDDSSDVVLRTSDNIRGSLRYAIDCACDGDTIIFHLSMIDSTILLESPAIVVDKEIYLFTDQSNDITISNLDSSNTEVLMHISDNFHISGLRISGKTEDSMIFKIESGGSVNFYSSEIGLINVDN